MSARIGRVFEAFVFCKRREQYDLPFFSPGEQKPKSTGVLVSINLRA